ncbi:MAG TPA: hypothetical protein VLJ68_01920 [Chitinophagaceae bacterium]|nr:hypothetical protein [Chitinophagaceae bacterium]
MTNTTAQDFLFQRIRELLPQDSTLAEAVSEILHVSNDSAYRRIRGETLLVLEEARTLCDHFHLSLDQLLKGKSGFTLFQTQHVVTASFSFANYLKEILGHLEVVNGCKKKELVYLSKDLPFFHNFIAEPLLAFHYFFWMKSIVRQAGFEKQKFKMDCLTDEIRELGRKILELYNSIPSSEIWNTECVDSLIFQIESYKEAGYFSSPGDIKKVYEAVEDTINHLKDQAEAGCKFLRGESSQFKKNDYQFFYNRVTLGDNTVLAVMDNFKMVFLNYDVLNYISTRDEKFCNEIHDDLRALIRRSTMISSTSEKQRNIFFRILLGKIQERKNHLK